MSDIPKSIVQMPGVSMTNEDIRSFLEYLTAKGRAPSTVERYGRELEHLSAVLPEDKIIRQGTLEKCREALLSSGYSPRTVNLHISVANSYLDYAGHREYQLRDTLEFDEFKSPEITRNEYIHLLQLAQLLNREKAYLLVKVFANADVPVQELTKFTVEAVSSGQIIIGVGSVRRNVRLPRCISRELLSYAERNGIKEGPIFLTKDRTPLDRTTVTSAIRELCLAAKVPVEKGNPRCLRRLYLAGRKSIEDNVAFMIEQALERQVEEEQLMVAWEEQITY